MSTENKAYICPKCQNKTLYQVFENDNVFICDECGAELNGTSTFKSGMKFTDVEANEAVLKKGCELVPNEEGGYDIKDTTEEQEPEQLNEDDGNTEVELTYAEQLIQDALKTMNRKYKLEDTKIHITDKGNLSLVVKGKEVMILNRRTFSDDMIDDLRENNYIEDLELEAENSAIAAEESELTEGIESESDESALDLALMSFETGHQFEENDFDSKEMFNDYRELMELGPVGFYNEYKDELSFTDDFVAEYGSDGDLQEVDLNSDNEIFIHETTSERAERVTWAMNNYVDQQHGFKVLSGSGDKWVVEANGLGTANIEFDLDWPEYVYIINGHGPYAHSSYEYICGDIADALTKDRNKGKQKQANEAILKEGPGAGYTITGKFSSIVINKILRNRFQDGVLTFDVDGTACLEDVTADSYYYGMAFENDVPVKLTQISLEVPDSKIDEVLRNAAEEITYSLEAVKMSIVYGRGYVHKDFDGKLSLDVNDLDHSDNYSEFMALKAVIEFMDQADINDLNTGVTQDIYSEEDDDEDFIIESASTDDKTRWYHLAHAYNGRKDFSDREKQSGMMQDMIDELENKGINYEIYFNTSDAGCSIFYEDSENLVVESTTAPSGWNCVDKKNKVFVNLLYPRHEIRAEGEGWRIHHFDVGVTNEEHKLPGLYSTLDGACSIASELAKNRDLYDTTTDWLTESAPRLDDGTPDYSVVNMIKAAYERGLFNRLTCIGRENACTYDINSVDKERLIAFFDKQPEFNREDHNESGIYSVEFISDKFDIEVFDSFIQIYKIPQTESVESSVSALDSVWEEFQTYVKDEKLDSIIEDLYKEDSMTFTYRICNGDWKHEHAFVRVKLIEFFNKHGLRLFVGGETEGDSEDDCYTANYTCMVAPGPNGGKPITESAKLGPTSAYMLRNDGTLIDCNPVHPYVKYIIQNSDKEEIRALCDERPEQLIWFYNNTNNEELKEIIGIFTYNVLNNDAFIISDSNKEKLTSEIDLVEQNVKDEAALYNIFNQINDETNQEFCRVRTSHMKAEIGTSGEIYFRISSKDFNWFSVIWDIVNSNNDFVTFVTICTDSQSLGGRPNWYSVNGKQICQMPKDEFLTLPGNPVIESTDASANLLMQGKTLSEAFGSMPYVHIHNTFTNLRKKYVQENFELSDKVYESSFTYGDYKDWRPEDIELHKSIDWKSRNYLDYPVESDTFEGEITLYGVSEPAPTKKVKMVKYLRANPIFAPYYAADDAKPFDQVEVPYVGPSYDGVKHNDYAVMTRYETQDLYDKMFETVEPKANENKIEVILGSGVNADGFTLVVTNSEGKELFKQDYTYGYSASYDKAWADEKAPYTADIITKICNKYGVDKKNVTVTAGRNAFNGKPVAPEKLKQFADKYLSESYNKGDKFKNQNGETIEVLQPTDKIGQITYKICSTNQAYCVPQDSFENTLKDNGYRLLKRTKPVTESVEDGKDYWGVVLVPNGNPAEKKPQYVAGKIASRPTRSGMFYMWANGEHLLSYHTSSLRYECDTEEQAKGWIADAMKKWEAGKLPMDLGYYITRSDEKFISDDCLYEFGQLVCEHLNETFQDSYHLQDIAFYAEEGIKILVKQESDNKFFQTSFTFEYDKMKNADDLSKLFWHKPYSALRAQIEEYKKSVNEALIIREDFEESDTALEADSAIGWITTYVNDMIVGEYDTISQYNMLLEDERIQGDARTVVEDIVKEEFNHIGLLQSLLCKLDSNAEQIEDGVEEFEELTSEVATDNGDEITEDIEDNSTGGDSDDNAIKLSQKYTSAKTSINSGRLPAAFNMITFTADDVVLDYGCGKFDNTKEAVEATGAKYFGYDPYNRSAEYNDTSLKSIMELGGATKVVCSNVLNVIAEEEVRLDVIQNCKKNLRNGGTCYFTVYEGNGSGEGRETSAGYQLNKKTKQYLEEIGKVFSDIKTKGKLIIAR